MRPPSKGSKLVSAPRNPSNITPAPPLLEPKVISSRDLDGVHEFRVEDLEAFQRELMGKNPVDAENQCSVSRIKQQPRHTTSTAQIMQQLNPANSNSPALATQVQHNRMMQRPPLADVHPNTIRTRTNSNVLPPNNDVTEEQGIILPIQQKRRWTNALTDKAHPQSPRVTSMASIIIQRRLQ